MKVRTKLWTWVLAVLTAFVLVLGVNGVAFAAAGDVPDHDKILVDNGDGTYTIALTVTGDSERKPQKVNVIVIVDRSNSMDTQSGTGAYVPSNQNGTNMYGLVDGAYVPLTRVDHGWGANPRYTYNVTSTGEAYTGQRYQYDTTASRMQATKAAVDDLASTLLSYNGKDGNPNDTVEMALVDFATSARTLVAETTDATTFTDAVNGIDTPGGNAGGTNWEMALREADTINFGDSDPTYVIFFSDGAPTFYGTGPSGTGGEQEPNMANSYNASTDEAAALAQKVGVDRFYTIFAYGSDAGRTYMTNLTAAAGAPAGNNYSASNTAELEDAFAAILEAIEMAGIGNVGISDGTTSNVGTSTEPIDLLEVVPNFKYYRAGGSYSDIDDYDPENGEYGQEWADAPEAQFTDPTVTWNIPGILENDVVYTVTFDCYPSQTTLDTIADIKNDPSSYDTLDPQIKKYIDEDGNLATNTTASLTYTDTRTGVTDTKPYTNPDPVETQTVEEMAVSKEWKNDLEDEWQKPESITLDVTRDDDPTYDVTLNDGNNWTDSVYVSIGLIKDGEALRGSHGHDFTFVEPPLESGYRWEINVPTVHPMKIDGTVTLLILKEEAPSPYTNPDGADEYVIDGKTYYVGSTGAANLTATNERRSSLNIVKAVDGVDVPEDAVFPFTLNVVNSLAPETAPSEQEDPGHDSDYWVWISVRDMSETDDPEQATPVTDAVVSGATHAGGGWYYGVSGQDIVLNVKDGYSIRVNNLPVETTYTITEGTLPTGFTFEGAEIAFTDGAQPNPDWAFTGAQTSTGSVDSTNAVYTVTYNNKYELIDINVDKVWADANDQDGIRPDELTLTLNGVPAGTTVPTPEITKSEDGNTWTYTWKALPRYDVQGNEIAYTVSENTVPEGYEVSGSPANDGGTITNTHEPEVVDVTVVKEWDDSDNIGGIRPTSIQAQLKADGVESGDPVTLNEGNEWTYTWENLPKYKNGTEIVYSADETAVPAGYTKSGPESETAQDGTITFTVTNTYAPTPATASFPVEKVLEVPEGLEGPAEWEYTFTVAGTPAAATMTATVDQDNTSATFGDFTFDMPGTYTYTVTESGTVDGVTNDSETTKTVTITVADNGSGVLTATVAPAAGITFTNTYSVDPTTASFPVEKILSAADGLTPPDITGEYTIALAAEDGTPMPATTSYTNPDPDGGVVTFGAIEYTAPGTYTYTVTESGTVDGVTNDSAAATGKTVTVTVVDNGDGTLTATPSSTADEPISFTNTYEVGQVTASIPVQKVMEVPEGMEGPENWTYTITATANDGAPEAESMTATVTKASPSASIGEITFTEPGTYSYTVTESGTVAGVTNGTASYDIEIVVSDNGDGTLTAVVNGDEAVVFTNTYSVEPATASFPVEKVMSVPEDLDGPAEWSYDITVTANNGAPEAEAMTGTVDQDTTSITFGDFTFDAPGTYTYTVSESGDIDGVTNDTEADGKTVTVTVVDNGDGTLTATVAPTAGITFTNTYSVEPTTASISAEKVLEVPEGMEGPAEWSYDIAATAQGDAPVASVMSGSVNQDTTSITFGPITYTKPGTYTYNVSESGTVDGVTNDSETTKTVTVEVIDNGDGTLTATASPETGVVFTNTYNASGEATIEVTKAVTGAAWPAGKSLTLTIEGDDPMPETTSATLTAAGKATFGPITYSAPGEYAYTISEDGFGAGWEGSGDITATVTVTDNGDGKLVASVAYDPTTATITNTYKAEGSITLDAKKVLEGRDWMDGESYTFTLTDKNGEVVDTQTVTKDNADSVTFATINYTEADAGKTFEYTITETGELPANVSKSGPITATVTVTDNGNGTLATSATYSPEDKTITNTYDPTTVKAQINVNKTIEGFIPGADQTFTFTLTPGEGAPGEVQTKTITTENGSGSTSFDEIEYTEVGEYTYTVVETKGDAAGFTYDTTEYTVTVKVTDNPEEGKLEAEVVYEKADATGVDVINEFAEEATEVTLHVDKKIEDQSGSAEDATFTFVLTPGEGAPGETQTITVTTEGLEGGADFAPIEFTEAGTFNYTIQETGTAPSGWTYDTKEYPVVITITDDFEDAILNSETTIDGEAATSLTITNVYKAAETTSTLEVTKEIDDKSGSAPDDVTFTFTLATTDDSPMPDPATTSVTGAGIATFGEITYDHVGEYHYTITETNDAGAGWTYDTKSYPVVVSVTDDGGQLVATVAYGEDSSTELSVTNIYDPEDAKATPKAHKVIEDLSGSAPDETFEFTLTPGEGAPGETQTKTLKNGGFIEFDEITFDKVGTFTYTIKETAGSTSGWTYDSADHTVTITVEDKGEGQLVATVTYGDGEEALLTNTYKAEPVEVELNGLKVLEGGKKLEEGAFAFELLDNDGNKVDGTFTNDADGNIAFGAYTFEKVGTYTYTATEVTGDDPNMTYDSAAHAFTIVVTDEGGQLVAEVTGDEAELVKFTNTYTPEPVTIDPPVQKVITGDKPDTAATFTFQMKALTEGAPMPAESGNGIKTIQITGAGSMEFGEVVYTEPGEWKYEITELNGGVKGYTYDSTVYTLTVTVTQNEDGTLTKEEKIDGGDAIVFTNKYEKPPVTPVTGDVTPMISEIAGIAALGSGLIAAGALRRRRED